jgi:hypothetical protein
MCKSSLITICNRDNLHVRIPRIKHLTLKIKIYGGEVAELAVHLLGIQRSRVQISSALTNVS